MPDLTYWLIERRGRPTVPYLPEVGGRWFKGWNPPYDLRQEPEAEWTNDAQEAIRFCRRCDVDQILTANMLERALFNWSFHFTEDVFASEHLDMDREEPHAS